MSRDLPEILDSISKSADDESVLTREDIDFGSLGMFRINQFAGAAFHHACSQETTNKLSIDATGLRVHPASHVLIRFLIKYPQLLQDKHVIELGAGTGVSALGALLATNPASYLATDGNSQAVSICRLNIDTLLSYDSKVGGMSAKESGVGSHGSSSAGASAGAGATPKNAQISISASQVQCEQMMWDESSVLAVLQTMRMQHRRVDVVLGSELLYYRTDLQALCSTIVGLAGDRGVFIGAHIFRKAKQDEELARILWETYGWVLVVCPLQDFVLLEEQKRYPGWFNAVQLLAGSEAAIKARASSLGVRVTRADGETTTGTASSGSGDWKITLAPVKAATEDDCGHTGDQAGWMADISL